MADENAKPDKTRLAGIKLQTRAQAWLSGKESKPAIPYNSIWNHREDGPNLDIDKVLADRQTAMTKTKTNAANTEGGSEEAPKPGGGPKKPGEGGGKHVLQSIMRKARANIFPEGAAGWKTWEME